jgi:YegS/Rv2252/BmrU family lipid kinase
MKVNSLRRVLVLINPRSGLGWSFSQLRRAMDNAWDRPGIDLTYQFCQSFEDSTGKVDRAIALGADTIIVVGGDGTVNSIGRMLIGTDVTLGIVPVGSGNGFARHFSIPLSPAKAVLALANGIEQTIDVGVIGDTPFLVTASMAWEAAIAETFEKSPIRGILPYVLAGVQKLFEYVPQDLKVRLDASEEIIFKDPVIFTVANLSQYGGGAKIAPRARADDGYLELVVTRRQDMAKLIANIGRLFDGTIARLPEVVTHRFKEMEVFRERAAPIQMDGELVDAPSRVHVSVRPASLKVLVPR